MFDRQVHDPQLFIDALRQFHESDAQQRGQLANALADAIITKRVDLGEVRLRLHDAADQDLLHTLDALLDLIEPYIEEGGVDE